MTNTLMVVKPFFVMEAGDTFEKTGDGSYASVYSSEYSSSDAEGGDVQSAYTSRYEISESYAKNLLKDGFLKEVKDRDNFVNVFDEIEKLKNLYSNELETLDEDYANAPSCLKIEKKTVLENLSKVLNHLSGLKK